MGLMSKLDAVNELLFNAGEQIVTSLTDSLNTDVNLAEFTLNQQTLEHQLRGLAANYRPIKVKPSRTGPVGHSVRPISSATKGRVLLSDYTDDMQTGSLISAELITNLMDTELDVRITAAPRRFGIEANGKDFNVLYNVTNKSDEWDLDQELYINIVEFVAFEDLETTVQKAIVANSSRQYQLFVQGDRDVDRLLGEKAAMLTAKGRAADMNDKRRNLFSSGDGALRRILNRNSNGVYDPSRFRFWRHRS
jgi:hypothetical protein